MKQQKFFINFKSMLAKKDVMKMNISPVSFRQNNLNLLKNNSKTPKTNNYTNNFTLPNYNSVSFKALIKDYGQNPIIAFSKEEKEEMNSYADNMLEFSRIGDEQSVNSIMKKFFEKYGNNEQAHKYIISKGINTKNKRGDRILPEYTYMKAYFDNVNEMFKNDRKKARKYLSLALFTKNENNNTLAFASANTNKNMVKMILEKIEDFPDLQAKVLMDRNYMGQSLGQKVLFSQSQDGKKVNEVLNKLCSKTKSISRSASIDLLRINHQILDEENQEVLEALLSKDCVCYGELSKAYMQKSYTSLTSKDFERLDELAKQITIHGGTLTKGVVLTDVPSVEMMYMCIGDKESYLDADSVDVLKIFEFFNESVDVGEFSRFLTTQDSKGRCVASALCKSPRGLQLINESGLKYGSKTLYNTYMHKDIDGKTIADYMLSNKDALTDASIKALNDGLIDICASGIAVKDLKALKDTYENLLDYRMKKIGDEIDKRVRS